MRNRCAGLAGYRDHSDMSKFITKQLVKWLLDTDKQEKGTNTYRIWCAKCFYPMCPAIDDVNYFVRWK